MCSDYDAASKDLADLGKELERLRKVEAEYKELREHLLEPGTGYGSCECCGRIRFEDEMEHTEDEGSFCKLDRCQRKLGKIERQAQEQEFEDFCRNQEIRDGGLSHYYRNNF